jgi:hypothetical protein
MRVAEILKDLAEVYATLESTPVTEEVSTEEGTEAAQTEDQVEAAGQPLPRWRRKCIMTYARCIDEKWDGRCDACLQLCVGQRKWPKDRCPNPQDRN